MILLVTMNGRVQLFKCFEKLSYPLNFTRFVNNCAFNSVFLLFIDLSSLSFPALIYMWNFNGYQPKKYVDVP